MDRYDDHHAAGQELAALQQDFPGFRIWPEATGERVRLVAVRRQHGTRPHTVVTADLAELRSLLASGRQAHPVTSSPPPADGEKYPQAIADDYPGWDVRRQDGEWTASCPAVTVHADTPAALRAAIEAAIWGNTEH